MTHTGKIGRLPKTIRDELGHRLEDGLPGTEIVDWLNAQTDVQDVLNRHFQGRAITEQNLSEWRQSGRQNWLRRQDATATARNFLEQAQDLEKIGGQWMLSNQFANIFTVELTRLAMALLDTETDPEKKWRRLCEIHLELSRLRRDDARAARTVIEQERWQYEYDCARAKEAERKAAEAKQKTLNLITGVAAVPVHRDCFGGGKQGQQMAELLYRVLNDLPYDDWIKANSVKTPPPAAPAETDATPPAEAPVANPDTTNSPANPGESNLIQPDPTTPLPPERGDVADQPQAAATPANPLSTTSA